VLDDSGDVIFLLNVALFSDREVTMSSNLYVLKVTQTLKC